MGSSNPAFRQKIILHPSFGLPSTAIPFSAAAIEPQLDNIHINPTSTSVFNYSNMPNSKYNDPSFSSSNDACKAQDNNETAPVIATNSNSAASLYRNQQLWTDFTISGTSVRVAFRYILGFTNTDKSDDETSKDDSKEQVYLCWIDSDGTPHHFYSMPSTFDYNEVNEADHIETTHPGHGFVFCKLLNEDMAREIVERVKGGEIGKVRNKDGVYVVDDECGVVFLKRREADDSESESEGESASEDESEDESASEDQTEEGAAKEGNEEDCTKCDESDDEGSQVSEVSHWSFIHTKKTGGEDRSDSEQGEQVDQNKDGDIGDSESNTISPSDLEGEWEAYVIVGGFRLRSKAVPASVQESNNEEGGSESDVKEGDEVDESSSSSDSDDEDEWSIQLVTLMYQKAGGSTDQEGSPPSLRGTPKNAKISSISGDLCSQFLLTAKLNKLDPTPICSVNKHYDDKTLGGWPCNVEPRSLSHRKLRKRIIADLKAASLRLPPHAREKLQKSTPIWINKSLAYGPKVAPIRGANMCFHPGSGWLIRNGMNPAKSGGVEMYKSAAYLEDCHLWGVGGLMLHELSHAWHFLHCDDGYDNIIIKDCFDKAMKEALYDCVPFHCGRGKKDKRKAYACTNAMEYFAELSAAFLGGIDDKEYNKWYPFNRKQIKEHDPRAFEMLCQMWGVDGLV
ncbi:hypothetical protein ACHAXN_008470 [Cyclotella atomus]